MKEEIKKLSRYTTLPFLLDYLERKKLVLLDPSMWEDKNDSLIIENYKLKTKYKKVLALCFSYKNETIHHWKTFANGPSGCCIEFNGKKLINIFKQNENLRHGVIRYKKIKDLYKSFTALNKIPFRKRVPYSTEGEYRLIWESFTDDKFEIDVPIEIITRITFSQHIPVPVFETLRILLQNRYGVPSDKIRRSTIYENKRWINHFMY